MPKNENKQKPSISEIIAPMKQEQDIFLKFLK